MDRVSKKLKKYMLVMLTAVMVLTIAYTAVLPAVVANQYLNDIEVRAAGLKPLLKTVASGASAKLFSNPDIPLQDRQLLIAKTLQDVDKVRLALDHLESANSLSRLPGNGFAGDYHKAIVRRQMTSNMVGQSRQVLEKYSGLLDYVDVYTRLQLRLDEQLNAINQVRDFNKLLGASKSITTVAASVKQDRMALARLRPPPELEQLQTEALATFDRAAAGFERLAAGLSRASDPQIYSAVRQLEVITEKNQVADKDLLIALASNSSVLRQLDELPEKAEHALEG